MTSAFATTSPLRAAEAALAADTAHNDPAVWITRLPDAAILEAALALEAEGPRGRPLWGTSFAVKDNIDIAGLPTTAACPGFRYEPSSTAPVVQRLLDAGALLVGKTNLDQFATGLAGVRSPYGVPRNVFDPSRVPGGSSSGSACAVAAGIVTFALGTDTAGSGRVPAAFGNVVGLKPTIGSFSGRGIVPACRSIETVSVFARSVDEALAVARAAASYDDADPYSRAAPFAHLRRGEDPAHARIAVADTLPECDAPMLAAYARAASLFDTVPSDIAAFLEIARLLYDGPWVAERSAALRGFIAANPDALHPATRTILEAGFSRLSIDAFDAFHRLAACRRFAARLFRSVDALLLPTAPFCPSLDELAADPIGPNSRLGTFTNFVNLCDLAAIAVPAGFGSDGVPVGVTLIGPAWSESRLAGLSDRVHRGLVRTIGASDQPLPPRPGPDAIGPDETPLFCLGAHMSGLPLNHEIRALGGRFVRAAETTAEYRLYALGRRPGLVRVDPGDGASIAGEVWALPTAAIGALLARVPPPLSFGTVQLADGPCLGFLAEAFAVADAPDVSRYGGWRCWLDASTSVTVD
ncbi:MAG TPA: allophanate hydrolase [Acetobacteraceae bacterium]|jgi:allophanate hydrolase|nr:allophanate hydrolase [Acetobacteraceae bacterium]